MNLVAATHKVNLTLHKNVDDVVHEIKHVVEGGKTALALLHTWLKEVEPNTLRPRAQSAATSDSQKRRRHRTWSLSTQWAWPPSGGGLHVCTASPSNAGLMKPPLLQKCVSALSLSPPFPFSFPPPMPAIASMLRTHSAYTARLDKHRSR